MQRSCSKVQALRDNWNCQLAAANCAQTALRIKRLIADWETYFGLRTSCFGLRTDADFGLRTVGSSQLVPQFVISRRFAMLLVRSSQRLVGSFGYPGAPALSRSSFAC